MRNRLNIYRDDLTYPEWLEEYKTNLKKLHEIFKDEHECDMDFQGFTIGMYMETKHAMNIAERRN
tara:strand:+ start:538 stop:732 length:195 start_codon:yes stop_codon:yes gene_type:complete